MAHIERFGGHSKPTAAKLASPYQRGDFWLGVDPKSPNWILMRYCKEKRQTVKASTRTSDLEQAKKVLDREFLSATDQGIAFCSTCGQKVADGDQYGLIRAIKDYKIEHASELISYETVRARLEHVIAFVLDEFSRDIPCSAAITDKFVKDFRSWLLRQPVQWRSKDGGLVEHNRTASSVEGSVRALRAAMNHAVRMGRSDAKPLFRSKSTTALSMPVRTRASIEELALMFDYAQACPRRSSLLRFLVASITTGARPNAIYDINIDPDRFQWDQDEALLNLNPFGREQTKKFRPTIPILHPLEFLLRSASDDGWVIHYYGRHSKTVRNPWRTMISDLGLGSSLADQHRRGREYGTYLIRRSVATLLRDRQTSFWDLQGFLGHRVARTTETYATSILFPTAMQNLLGVITDIQERLGKPIFDPRDPIQNPMAFEKSISNYGSDGHHLIESR